MTARENVRLGVQKWAKLDGITPDLGVMPQTRRHQRFRCKLQYNTPKKTNPAEVMSAK